MTAVLRLALCLSCALIGCSPALSLPRLPLPAARSLVLVLLPDHGEPQLWAFDFPGGAPEYLAVPSSVPGQLYALSYACSLASVGLSAGPVRPDSSGTALPPAQEVITGRMVDGATPEWTAADPAPEALRSLLVHRQLPSRCVEFDKIRMPLDGKFFSAALLGSREIVLALSNGIEVHQLPSMTRLEQWPGSFAAEPRGAARDGAGWVYLAGATGTIDVISPEHQRETLTASTGTTANPLLRVHAAVPTTPGQRAGELFLAAESGRVEHWDGRRWQLLHFERQPRKGKEADIVWTGPGEAQAVGVSSNRVLEISGSTVTPMRILDRDGILARIFFHPTRGRMFFTADGRLVLPDGSGGYVEQALTAIGQRTVASVVATEEGFMAGAYIGGQIEQYFFDGEKCPPLVVDLENIEQLVAFEGSYFVFGDGFDNKSYLVSMVPSRIPERCQ